jgi:hypothetical protein
MMTPPRCKLCALEPAIPQSHILPAFVARAIKADSPTGFLRNPYHPNRRLQDLDKTPLLGTDCEQRFALPERWFAETMFFPFHKADQDEFEYDQRLHYFMTSLGWRTLALDLPGFRADPMIAGSLIANLESALATMSQYLLGANHLAPSIRNHAVILRATAKCDPELASIGPNVAIRRSVFGYTLVDKKQGHAAVLHNLAGFVCVLIIKGNPRDVWNNTKVLACRGQIRQPQQVHSTIMADLFDTVILGIKKLSQMSDAQKAKVRAAELQNPGASVLRFKERDRHVRAVMT